MSFDIDDEIATLNEDLENIEIKDFLTEIVKWVKETPYTSGARIEDRFLDGFVNINEHQKRLLNVGMMYEFWKFVHGEKTMA